MAFRLTAWEDAIDAGLVRVDASRSATQAQAPVELMERGVEVVKAAA